MRNNEEVDGGGGGEKRFQERMMELPCCKRVSEAPCRPWHGGVWAPAPFRRPSCASYLLHHHGRRVNRRRRTDKQNEVNFSDDTHTQPQAPPPHPWSMKTRSPLQSSASENNKKKPPDFDPTTTKRVGPIIKKERPGKETPKAKAWRSSVSVSVCERERERTHARVFEGWRGGTHTHTSIDFWPTVKGGGARAVPSTPIGRSAGQ